VQSAAEKTEKGGSGNITGKLKLSPGTEGISMIAWEDEMSTRKRAKGRGGGGLKRASASSSVRRPRNIATVEKGERVLK